MVVRHTQMFIGETATNAGKRALSDNSDDRMRGSAQITFRPAIGRAGSKGACCDLLNSSPLRNPGEPCGKLYCPGGGSGWGAPRSGCANKKVLGFWCNSKELNDRI
jgi:hypothetical protein